MRWNRMGLLFDRSRLAHCQPLFRRPWRARIGLSFIGHRPVTLETRCGQSLTFSRDRRDHHFWDWYFNHPVPLSFTADGLLEIEYDGRTLTLRPGTCDFVVFDEIFLKDEYGLSQSDKHFGTVVDLGANAGMFTCAVLPMADRVIAVEAVQANYEHAVRNIECNGGAGECIVHAAVAARSEKTIRIYHSPSNSGGHSVSADWIGSQGVEQHDFETCRTISLADLFDRFHIDTVDLLKCDIEGGEYDVLLNVPPAVLSQIGEIAMEVHVSTGHGPGKLRELLNRLKTHGFEVQSDRPIPETDRRASFVVRAVNRRIARAKAA